MVSPSPLPSPSRGEGILAVTTADDFVGGTGESGEEWKTMLSSEIREKFLRFFEDKGCLIAPSDSLTPNDPTLLFTSAGMVQFKPYFTGERVPPRTRMTTSQKCLRTGDLDIVGTTPFHHTFFEMLGNFSFGDYFKYEAITWAWEFLMTELKFRPEQIWVSVYLHDDEAAEIWEKTIGIPKERMVRLRGEVQLLAVECTERRAERPVRTMLRNLLRLSVRRLDADVRNATRIAIVRDSARSGTWFHRSSTVRRAGCSPLSARKNIDTGMGLERVTAIIQGTPTNFETDLFMPIIREAASIAGIDYGNCAETDTSLKVIADHSRAMVFSISDGVMPSNVGRGYVLRRIIRRAVLKGKSLGLEGMFLERLVPVIVSIMESPYPELREREDYISRTVRAEEEKFRRTLDMGLQKLEETINKHLECGSKEIPGMEAFVLYDTYGFPLELVQEKAAECGMTVDLPGFETSMEEQRRRAREGSDISTDVFAGSLGALAEIEKVEAATEFVGYESFSQ